MGTLSGTSDTEQRRIYLDSHPWLTFQLDLSRPNHELWLLLGEAGSKIEHISGALLKPDVATRMHYVFLAKGVHATTAIEGNTLTEEQAQQLLQGQLRLPESQEYLAREMDNIIAVFNAIRDELLQPGGQRELSPDAIKRYNGMVLAGLDVEEGVIPGELRRHSVVVARYRGAPWEDCGYLLERLCEWLNGSAFVAPAGARLRLPLAILKAVVAHLYLAWIHPFGDGNGRTARLMEHQILLAAGVPTPATHLLSNHYNQTRSEYQRCLDEASRAPDGALQFVHYAVRGFVDGLRDQLALIREQQHGDRWEQYIYEVFGDTKSASKIRQRQLVLDLSKADGPVARNQFRELSPALAAAYASKTSKTLSRDINALVRLNLIRLERFKGERERIRHGWVPNREIIEAFLPIAAAEPSDLSH